MTDETTNNPLEELAPEPTRPRGRKKGYVMPQSHRDKMKNSNALNRLIQCADGELELTPVQASVGLGLIKKVLPDLQSAAHRGDEDAPAIKMNHKIERLIVDPANSNS